MRALALASVFLVVLTALASGQGQPNPQGAVLFEEGRALLGQGKYAEACAKFEQSLAIDPAIGTQLNLGECHEKQGHNATAWRIFDAAADAEKITNPDRAKFSRGRADALLAKLGVIVLNLTTPDAPMLAVSIAGRTVKPAPVIKEIVDPGDVVINVTAQGAAPYQRSEKIVAGKTVTINVPALEPRSSPVVGPEPTEPEDTSWSPRKKRVVLAYVAAGVGLVGAIAGIAIGAMADSDYEAQFDGAMPHCVSEDKVYCDATGFDALNDARSFAHVGTFVGTAGWVLMGAGVVLYLTAPKEDVAVAPTATANSAGISVVGRF